MMVHTVTCLVLVLVLGQLVHSYPPPPFKGYGRPRPTTKIRILSSGPSRRPSYRLISSSPSKHFSRHHTFSPGRGHFKPSPNLADCAKQGSWKPIITPEIYPALRVEGVWRGPPEVPPQDNKVEPVPAFPIPQEEGLNGVIPPGWWTEPDIFKGNIGGSSLGGDLVHNEVDHIVPTHLQHASREYEVHESVDDVPPPKNMPRGGTQLPMSVVPTTTPMPAVSSTLAYRPNFFRRRRQKSSRNAVNLAVVGKI